MRMRTRLALLSIATGVGWFGQGVGLPLFLATFENDRGMLVTGPYFIASLLSTAFVVALSPTVLVSMCRGGLQRERAYARTWRGGGKLTFFGVCNGVSGLLKVYASSTTRVEGALQPILVQSTLLFTVLGSRIYLRKRYGWGQLRAAGLVLLGIGISLVPSVGRLIRPAGNGTAAEAEGGDGGVLGALAPMVGVGGASQASSSVLWPLVLVLACAPVAAMNIVQESIFDDVPAFDVPYLLASTSLVQLLFIGACWWTDIVPSFGTSSDLDTFWKNMVRGVTCFFEPHSSDNPARCGLCAPLGGAYFASILVSLYFGSKVVRLASANLQALLITLASATCIYFWLAFHSIARWSGGKVYTVADVVATSVALAPLAMGVVLFRLYEPDAARVEELRGSIGGLRAGAAYLVPESPAVVVHADAPSQRGVQKPGPMGAPLLCEFDAASDSLGPPPPPSTN